MSISSGNKHHVEYFFRILKGRKAILDLRCSTTRQADTSIPQQEEIGGRLLQGQQRYDYPYY